MMEKREKKLGKYTYRIYDTVEKKYIKLSKKSIWLTFPSKAISVEEKYHGKFITDNNGRYQIHEFEHILKEKYDPKRNVIVEFSKSR